MWREPNTRCSPTGSTWRWKPGWEPPIFAFAAGERTWRWSARSEGAGRSSTVTICPDEDSLKDLLETEIASRQQRTCQRRLREARFPDLKTLEQIDWEALKGVSRPQLLELAVCEYIERAEDIVLAGPIGTGKTHLAIALGIEATQRRYRVVFTRAADLVQSLLEARDERQLGRLYRRLQKVDLLIVDELGFVPFEKAGGQLLFNLLSDRYERNRPW